MNTSREKTIQAYAGWLRGFRWDWFVTLKLTSGSVSDRRAKRLFDEWISEMDAADGSAAFRWVRVMEKGGWSGNAHFHALVGGFRNRRQFWAGKWDQRGGEALIEPYDAERKGLLYILKEMNDEGEIDIDFRLPRSATPNTVAGGERKRRG